MSVQLPVLDRPAKKSPPSSGNWFVSRDELARYRDAPPPTGLVDRTVWAIAEAMFGTPEGPPPAARLAWLVADLRDYLVRSGPRPRLIFTAAVLVMAFVAPIFIGKLPTFARLSVADRVRALEAFESGTLAQAAAILSLKVTLCIVYFEHPDAAADIGFDGMCKGIES